MKKSDWAVVGLNAFTLLVAVAGLIDPAGGAYEGTSIALVLSIVTLMVNGGWVLRRGAREATPPAADRTPTALPDELDARAVLDLDARLEALERAHADAADAARWRALVESGQASAPAAEAPSDATQAVRRPTANGQ